MSTEPARSNVFPLQVGKLEVLLAPKVLSLILRAAAEQIVRALSLLHSLLSSLLKKLTRNDLRVVLNVLQFQSFATGAKQASYETHLQLLLLSQSPVMIIMSVYHFIML